MKRSSGPAHKHRLANKTDCVIIKKCETTTTTSQTREYNRGKRQQHRWFRLLAASTHNIEMPLTVVFAERCVTLIQFCLHIRLTFCVSLWSAVPTTKYVLVVHSVTRRRIQYATDICGHKRPYYLLYWLHAVIASLHFCSRMYKDGNKIYIGMDLYIISIYIRIEFMHYLKKCVESDSNRSLVRFCQYSKCLAMSHISF